jgi:hypothetical protein
MLCLSNSIRHDDSSVQWLLRAVENAQTLAALILAVWPLARVLVLHVSEFVLAERARRLTSWSSCPVCGALLRSKNFHLGTLEKLGGPDAR